MDRLLPLLMVFSACVGNNLSVDADGGGGSNNPDLMSTSADGTPMQGTCTRSFGAGMSSTYGRLDGFVWSVVPSTDHRCVGDSNHIHLQIKMNGNDYNIAVTVVDTNGGDVFFLERDLALPSGWSEGWHPSPTPLDYVQLGLHANDFSAVPSSALQQKIEAELATANHISVFTTGFGTDGGHLVHRNNGTDGAIVLQPLSPKPHVLMFRFATQTF